MRGLSMLVASFLTQFGIIVMLANVIRRYSSAGGDNEIQRFELYGLFMYSLSIVALITLFILGYTGNLTKVRRRIRHKSFIRAGMLLLGSGGVVYHGARIIDFISLEAGCGGSIQSFSLDIMEMVFIILTMTFIFTWCEIDIVNNVWMTIFCRMLLTQIIATSTLVLAATVMEEAIEQITELEDLLASSTDKYSSSVEGSDVDASDILESAMWNSSYVSSLEEAVYESSHEYTAQYAALEDSTQVETEAAQACKPDGLAHTVVPYTFPLLVEYCIVSLSILLMLWDEVRPLEPIDREAQDKQTVNKNDDSANTARPPQNSVKTQMSNFDCSRNCLSQNYGVIFGWLLVLVGFILCLNSLKMLSDGEDGESSLLSRMVYGVSLAVSCLGIIMIPITLFLIQPMTFRDHDIKTLKRGRDGEHVYMHGGHFGKALDKGLLLITTFALVSFKLSSCMSVVDNIGLDAYIILADSAVCIIMAYMQTLFINYYASRKVAKTAVQQKEKPGNQGMYFLRCVNFVLWLINTLLLKNPSTQLEQAAYYGQYAWPTLSNVLQPLSILYYFHSFVFLSDVSAEAYLPDYIGIVRKEKQKGHGDTFSHGSLENKENDTPA